MSDATHVHDDSYHRILDALDEQMVEVKLFQAKLAELAFEVGKLQRTLDGFDDEMEAVSEEVAVLGSHADKTIKMMGGD